MWNLNREMENREKELNGNSNNLLDGLTED
jgi:hypothetical protein